MSLSIGIVGLPNVGKSTLFNALTDAGALAANYPFATIEPNRGIVPIPDPRVARLAEMFGSDETIPATVTFVDIAGLVGGSSRGEGLGNQFLANIRDVSAVCHVVRAFRAENVAHVSSEMSPASDIETIETELALADLQMIQRRLPKLEKEATVDQSLRPRVALLARLEEVMGSGELVYRVPELMSRKAEFQDLQLLTAKPVIFVFNGDQSLLSDPGRRSELSGLVAPAEALFLDAQFESELMALASEEAAELLASVGQGEPGLNSMVRAAYQTLGLQSFLTANEKAARAWTIPAGTTAADAAGVIHTDFQRGFIAAEVVSYPRLVEAGSWHEARSQGLVRTEGKSYVLQPDDVVEFRFNV